MTSKINLPGNPAGVMVRDETEQGIQNNSSNFHKIISWKNKINHNFYISVAAPTLSSRSGVQCGQKNYPKKKKRLGFNFWPSFSV